MYFGEIKDCDIANGEGVRVTLFVSGCTNRCPNCFQPQTWDFEYGTPFTCETEDYILSLLAPDHISGLTLLGGEPFEPSNQRALLPFVRRVREAYLIENGRFECPGLDTAFVLGFFPPRIYLPMGLSDQERKFIFDHENTHIARNDHWFKVLGYVI